MQIRILSERDVYDLLPMAECMDVMQGRKSDDEITLFKSLRIAVEDLGAAHYIYEKALKAGKGVEFDLGGPTA